jgi:hypothetical protein
MLTHIPTYSCAPQTTRWNLRQAPQQSAGQNCQPHQLCVCVCVSYNSVSMGSLSPVLLFYPLPSLVYHSYGPLSSVSGHDFTHRGSSRRGTCTFCVTAAAAERAGFKVRGVGLIEESTCWRGYIGPAHYTRGLGSPHSGCVGTISGAGECCDMSIRVHALECGHFKRQHSI